MHVGISTNRLLIGALASMSILASCASPEYRRAEADQLADRGALKAAVVDSTPFATQAWYRTQSPVVDSISYDQQPLVVYIGGDGYAFKRRYQVSKDPTPKNPVALRLASLDKSNAVVYIARPCQYIHIDECDPILWTSHRYSEEVVRSIDNAITLMLEEFGQTSVLLIGFSGGGTIATLIAARRQNVVGLVTLAGNLDHASWTTYHGVSELDGSLNAIDAIGKNQHIPQLHLVGNNDETVPVAVVKSYLDRSDGHRNVTMKIIDGYDHSCCWHKNWPQLLCEQDDASLHPACGTLEAGN